MCEHTQLKWFKFKYFFASSTTSGMENCFFSFGLLVYPLEAECINHMIHPHRDFRNKLFLEFHCPRGNYLILHQKSTFSQISQKQIDRHDTFGRLMLSFYRVQFIVKFESNIQKLNVAAPMPNKI